MKFEELLEKYKLLLTENNDLKKEIEILRAQLGIVEEQQDFSDRVSEHKSASEMFAQSSTDEVLLSSMSRLSDPKKKIELFMSLFKGRDDVYAKKWQNKKGQTGYSPVCLNEWKPGVCKKPELKCAACSQKAYAVLDEDVIEDHLRGNIIAGIYPMCLDGTCCFLAIDFDDEGWQKDITVLKDVCVEFGIPVAVERSRSGKGAHMWFFFENQMPAAIARRFGSALLTYSMNKRHEITFESYDRFFPNQDTMPKGGLGNLIALPLQKAARGDNNSVFIDNNFVPYDDQWGFLFSIKRLTKDEVDAFISRLCHGNELGVLKQDDEEVRKPWETSKVKLLQNDFPEKLEIVKAHMLFIRKSGISSSALNHLKRLAAFKNPEFYKAQAMRLPTYNKPRIISCADETEEYLCLPRGCEADLRAIFKEAKVDTDFMDMTNDGKSIDVIFNGNLRDEQPLALHELLKYDNGVLSGTTAFGKTIVAIKLMA